jgi:hypothetical protein
MPRRRRSWKHFGAATVEMAIVTPLLLTILFGVIEYSYVFSVRQTLIHAAREGARTASLPGSTDGDITSRVNDYLSPLGIGGYDIDIERATVDDPTERVAVSVPIDDVVLTGFFPGLHGFDLEAAVSMRKEGFDG